MDATRTRRGALWIGLFLAVLAYLYDLDSPHILKIGDEPRYIQITRVTAASGFLLPLRSNSGIDNTKPPLLFWQGIASTGWGTHWSLWRLRLPIVLYTGLTALLVGVLAARLGAKRQTGVLAALIYLGSFSTFQHGRPFLTNAPETLFLFLPLVLLITGEFTWGVAMLAGVSLGLGALYKSFLLVVPASAAIAAILWRRRGWRLGELLRRDSMKLAVMSGLGLGIFALWFAVDPQPEIILRQFVLQENIGKFGSGNYLLGLLSGPYPVWRIWLGNFMNMGFYALPLAALVWLTLREFRKAPAEGGLTGPERELWLYVLVFLVVYSVPRQRQENYILPTVAALSVLLALRWERIPIAFFRAGLALAGACLGLLLTMMLGIRRAVPDLTYAGWQLAAAAALLGLALLALANGRLSRRLFPGVVCGTFLCLGFALSPFDRRIEPAPGGPGLEALAGRTIWFPATFSRRDERYRFLVPGSEVAGYNGRKRIHGEQALADGKLTALAFDLGDSLPGGYVIYGELLDLRTRLPPATIRDVVVGARFDQLVYRLVILERVRP